MKVQRQEWCLGSVPTGLGPSRQKLSAPVEATALRFAWASAEDARVRDADRVV